MSKLSNRLRKIMSYVPKKAMIVSAVVAAAVVPFAVGAYGPERSTYTIEKPADHITFNSITNNPNIGDERNFVGARDVATGNNGANNVWDGNQITVQDGHEYYVRMYVHNNAASNLNLVAENVTAKFNVPTTTANKVEVSGILSASNATPNEYWDSVSFVSDKAFNLVYVPGSAKWENNSVGKNGGVKLSDSVVTNSGVKLGYSALDGKIPGCFEYAGYLTFKVKPQFQHIANIGIAKSVAKHNDIADATDKLEQTKWQQSIEAKAGEVVDYVIDYRNAGDANQLGVVIRDTLPEGMEYVPGSTKFVDYNSNGTVAKEGNWVGGDTITQNGLNASTPEGGFAPTKNAHSYVVMFSAKVKESAKPTECGTTKTLKNIAKVSATVDGERFSNTDDADVVIKGDDCKKEVSVAECKVLETSINKIKKNSDVKFVIVPKISGNNVKVVSTWINFGDGVKTDPALVENYTHTYDKVGTYTAKAYINFEVEGKDKKDVTSAACEAEVKVEETPEVPKEIEVCDITDKTIKTIKETEFNKSKHSKNQKDCVETPVPSTPNTPVTPSTPETPVTTYVPTALPQAGAEMFGLVGLGGLTTSAGYYISSRRKLRNM